MVRDTRDIEARIRASLRARAEDVEPTAHLYNEVKERVARRQRWTWALWGLAGVAGAAAVVLAVVVVPGLFRDTQLVITDPADSPTASPTTEPTTLGATVPAYVVSTDGQALHLRDGATGALVETLFRFPDESEAAILHVAVRPDPTVEDLTIAVMTTSEGSYDLWWARFGPGADGGLNRITTSPMNFNVEPDAIELPRPVWNSDGSELAWLFTGQDEFGANSVIQVQRWGTDGPAAEPVQLRIDDLAPGQLRLGAFVGTLEDGTIIGTLGQRGLGELGPSGSTVTLTELTTPATNVERTDQYAPEVAVAPYDGGAAIDRADGGVAAGSGGPTYTLVAGGSGGPDAAAEDSGLRVEWSADGDQQGTIAVPADLAATASPFEGAWLSVARDGVLLGRGGQGVLLVRDADVVVRLPGTVHHAAFVDAAPVTEPAPTTSPTDEPTEAAADAPPVLALGPDGVLQFVVDGTTRTVTTLPEGATGLEVRPGSTPDDVTLLYVVPDEHQVRWLRIVGGDVTTDETLPFQPDGSVPPAATWAPDGSAIALLTGASADGASLQYVGWSDGPGTDDTATDNASFVVDLTGLDAPTVAAWRRTLAPGQDELVVTSASERDRYAVVAFSIQPDGAVADPRFDREVEVGGELLAFESRPVEDGSESAIVRSLGDRVQLGGDVEFGGAPEVDLAVAPDAVRSLTGGADGWLVGTTDGVLWVEDDGSVVRVLDGVASASWAAVQVPPA